MAVLQLALTARPGFIEEENKANVNILICVCACRLFIFNISRRFSFSHPTTIRNLDSAFLSGLVHLFIEEILEKPSLRSFAISFSLLTKTDTNHQPGQWEDRFCPWTLNTNNGTFSEALLTILSTNPEITTLNQTDKKTSLKSILVLKDNFTSRRNVDRNQANYFLSFIYTRILKGLARIFRWIKLKRGFVNFRDKKN